MAGGPLGWLYPFEIQPLETRPAGGAVASLMNLLFSFVIGQQHPLPPLSLTTALKGMDVFHTCSSGFLGFSGWQAENFGELCGPALARCAARDLAV